MPRIEITCVQTIKYHRSGMISDKELKEIADAMTGEYKNVLVPGDVGFSDEEAQDSECVDLDKVCIIVDGVELTDEGIAKLAQGE